MADFVSSLVEMGFPKDQAEKAVAATAGRGVQSAMDWILSRPEEETTTPTVEPNEEAGAPEDSVKSNQDQDPASAVDEIPRSYKCEDCGKLFKNATEMEFHAAKTQHANFSESTEEKKALTEEEKRDQLKRIEEKLKQKRLEREDNEKKEALERERLRMKSGKEMAEAKRRFEEAEMKAIADARRREKIEDRQARERVKAQIELDKIARKAKFAAEAGTAAGIPQLPTPPPVSELSTPTVEASGSSESIDSAVKKDYKETKLQLRLPNGKSLVQTFGVNEPLAAVRLYVELNRTDGLTGSFNLMTNYPRKIFQNDDYECPLLSLGLVPSAVLMVTKSA